MELELTGIGPYRVLDKAILPHRRMVTVEEAMFTGSYLRAWTEPFDNTGRGDINELTARFQKRIDIGSPPPDIINRESIDDERMKHIMSAAKAAADGLALDITESIKHIAYATAADSAMNASERIEKLLAEFEERMDKKMGAAIILATSQAVDSAMQDYRWRSRISKTFRRH